MLNSILLHLSGCEGCDRAIELAANIALLTSAQLRGLSVLDMQDAPHEGRVVSAAQVLSDSGRRAYQEIRHSLSHDHFQEVASRFGIDFASQEIVGAPITSLAREAQFHDLLVLCCPPANLQTAQDLTTWQHLELAARSRVPTYISRGNQLVPKRVLLIYDGSESSALAIRTFLAHPPLPHARYRLLGVGAASDPKAERFRAMRAYCRARRSELEVGCLAGPIRRGLVPYTQKWEADLVVLSLPQNLGLWSRLTGEFSLSVLQQTELDLYLVG
ncbi:universal stress protein [Blastopirellula marina]|uniref:UspA domain-containing protein n=1 Tax=Blastopirellula marina TaxID=124 RepID=A0A2S8GC52_9BACT|nr:universal stress protein [Blastopirellula marina]PQO42027.1 hypothetical protein C5Y93_27095 [Blastopirellula marina]